MGKPKSAPQIFLSYAREDRELVEELYQKLLSMGFKPWMDTRDILPGENWKEKIGSAIEKSDFFFACLSPNSVSKRGVLQKEFKSALDIWDGMLAGDIYFIPVRLAKCDVPESMGNIQWVDLFEEDGLSRLEKALKRGMDVRAGKISGPALPPITSLPRSTHERGSIVNVSSSQTTTKGKSWRTTGLILGSIVALAVIPLIFNNYFYKVERPAVPEPCQVSTKPVHVGLSRLSGCSSAFQDQLADGWKGEKLVTSIIPQSFQASAEARRVANYDLVVWGGCSSSDPEIANLTFELTTSRKPYGVYEPSSLQVSGGADGLSDAGLALAAYQHGDYSDAIRLFDALPALSNSSAIALFKSNSLLFAERYEEAIASYKKIALVADINSAAAYNNMGMAYFTRDSERGIEQFDRSISLAKDHNAVEVEALALVNRSDYFRLQEKWKDAETDCKASLALNGHSAFPYLCLAGYQLMYYPLQSPGRLPLNEIDNNLDEAAKYNDAPALLYYLRASWALSHRWVRKQDAVDAYARFLTELEYRACLQEDHDSIEFANKQIERLTHP